MSSVSDHSLSDSSILSTSLPAINLSNFTTIENGNSALNLSQLATTSKVVSTTTVLVYMYITCSMQVLVVSYLYCLAISPEWY